MTTSPMAAAEQLIALIKANPEVTNNAGGCSPELLTAAEEQLGAVFPPSYRRLIEEFGTWDVPGAEFLGVYQTEACGDRLLGSVSDTLEARADHGLPSTLVLLTNDGGCDLIALDLSQVDANGEAPVVAWAPESVPERLAPDFGSYALRRCERAIRD